ncbi:Pr6Pr family membrane protein [Pedobacter sp. SYP-B3415]|uniref:Pr6Pr family membrane protein n=1 Tax=Pedobacter sp. SYP-B3415 TaxID=2496641 RepID=UPI00101B64BE|nr:Pr6Pr family membrane protein [Pedobacter sp. SYP-B3415]
MRTESWSKSFFIWTGFLTALFAVVVQLYLNIDRGGLSFIGTLINFLSFYTILTNILIMVCYAALLFGHEGRISAFFERPVTQTALMINIFVVGAIYNVVLRSLWAPEGLQWIVNELLHAFNPVWFLLFWLLFTDKRNMPSGQLLSWLLYPATYLVYTLVRGSFTGWYPYPFVNITQLGLGRVLLNCVAITAFFLILFLLSIAVGRAATRRQKTN